jgi:AcrR family transcriptional regulator
MTRDEQALATRAAVVESARVLWAQKGYFDTSTAEIVEAAGVGTRGALYHHFRDRKELFVAVFAEVQSRLARELATMVPPGSDPLETLCAALLGFLDLTARAADVQALLIDGPAVFGLREWHRIEELRGLATIEKPLAAAIAAGIVDDQPTRPLAQLLLRLADAAALSVAAADSPLTAREETGAALRVVIEGLRTRKRTSPRRQGGR